jgi:hypothetical protein
VAATDLEHAVVRTDTELIDDRLQSLAHSRILPSHVARAALSRP